MFSFFHRTPEIHVDCFTYSNDVYLNTPIVRASKTFPDWFKELPKNTFKYIVDKETNNHQIDRKGNLKDCRAFLDFYSKGIVIESWCDFKMIMDMEKLTPHYWWSFHNKSITFHERHQIGNGFANQHHVKLVSPWYFLEKTGINFMWVGAEWALDKYNFKILPGIITFDTQLSTNINIMYPHETKEFFIPIGTPLVHVIPLSEKKIKFKNHLISIKDYEKMAFNPTSSFYGWRQTIKLRERNKKRGTCPFGFGDNDE